MTVPVIATTPLTEAVPHGPLLVVGPSLGTTTALWAPVAAALGPGVEVLGWDLPGHGASPASTEPFTVGELAAGVLTAVGADRAFHYAGDSLGGAVGLALALLAPDRVRSLAPVCTGAQIGDPAGWRDRAALVRAEGTEAVVAGSRERWFGPGFTDREPELTERLLDDLRSADAESYAHACEALAELDLREELGAITAPTTVVSGTEDVATPADVGAVIAEAVPGARHVVLDGVGHLAPVEAVDEVAGLLRELIAHQEES